MRIRAAKTRAPPAIPPTRPDEPPAAAACVLVLANRVWRGLKRNEARLERAAALVTILEEIMAVLEEKSNIIKLKSKWVSRKEPEVLEKTISVRHFAG